MQKNGSDIETKDTGKMRHKEEEGHRHTDRMAKESFPVTSCIVMEHNVTKNVWRKKKSIFFLMYDPQIPAAKYCKGQWSGRHSICVIPGMSIRADRGPVDGRGAGAIAPLVMFKKVI